MKKKWIIFDVMGVIFTVGDDTNELLVPYVQTIDERCTRKRINEVYIEASLGKITSCGFWDSLGCVSNNNYKEIEKKYLDECLTLDDQFIESAKRLKKDYNLAILSNDVSEWGTYLRKKYKIDDLVEFSVISGDVSYRKPSKDIYKIALEKVNVAPEDCVFIDDRDKNLIPAQNLGMKVVRFLRDDTECGLENVVSVSSFKELENNISKVW